MYALWIDRNLSLFVYNLLEIEINLVPAVKDELSTPLEEDSDNLKDLINELSYLLTSEDYILIQEKAILMLNKINKCIKKHGDDCEGITPENVLQVLSDFYSLQENEFKQIVKKWTDVINPPKDLGNIFLTISLNYLLNYLFIC